LVERQLFDLVDEHLIVLERILMQMVSILLGLAQMSKIKRANTWPLYKGNKTEGLAQIT
jgi:hypothetical protein